MPTDYQSLPSGSSINDGDYEFVRHLVYEHSRINLGPDKRALVSARVAKRLRALGIDGYPAYCQRLKTPAGAQELGHLLDAISTNHTRFFREEPHFEFLKTKLLPQWHAQRGGRQPFRSWSAACSSGEEPYTLAIVLAESFGTMADWFVEATDISTQVLARAEQGVYDDERVSPVHPDLVRRYFQRGIGEWTGRVRVKVPLRQRVAFRHLNLFQPDYAFEHRFQLILCRNVMIYFDLPTQQELVERLTGQLAPGGCLLVGHSESLLGLRHKLKQLQPSIYRRE